MKGREFFNFSTLILNGALINSNLGHSTLIYLLSEL